jgi:hypothetical protein
LLFLGIDVSSYFPINSFSLLKIGFSSICSSYCFDPCFLSDLYVRCISFFGQLIFHFEIVFRFVLKCSIMLLNFISFQLVQNPDLGYSLSVLVDCSIEPLRKILNYSVYLDLRKLPIRLFRLQQCLSTHHCSDRQ